MQAYCMKCRTKREMKDPKAITMKNGKPATPELGLLVETGEASSLSYHKISTLLKQRRALAIDFKR